MQESLFAVQTDYYVPVLRILAAASGGAARKQEVLDELDRRYGQRIPPEHRGSIAWNDRVLIWAHYASCGRRDMVAAGYMANPEHGTWQITAKGRQWLADHPDAHFIPELASERNSAPRLERAARSDVDSNFPATGVSLATLERTRQVMGDKQFRPLWGELYDQLLAAERARAISDLPDAEIARSALRQVRRIQDYLQGRGDERPQPEQICDWAHFCYQLSLFREVVTLYALIDGGAVNSWYLERTRKIVAASKARL